MSKIKISKSTIMGALGIVTAIAAGVSAFTGEIDKQNTEKAIAKLTDEVAKLKNQ